MNLKYLYIAYRIGLRLVPTIKAIAKAARKDSPGGKRITPGELADILQVTPDPIGLVLEELDVELDVEDVEPLAT